MKKLLNEQPYTHACFNSRTRTSTQNKKHQVVAFKIFYLNVKNVYLKARENKKDLTV